MADTTIKISLTDRPPVKIDKTKWGLVASASWHDGEVECQANSRAWIKVRRHDDGRQIVYGLLDSQRHEERDVYAGYLVAKGEDVIAAIHRVGREIDRPDLAQYTIQDLPVEDLDDAPAAEVRS